MKKERNRYRFRSAPLIFVGAPAFFGLLAVLIAHFGGVSGFIDKLHLYFFIMGEIMGGLIVCAAFIAFLARPSPSLRYRTIGREEDLLVDDFADGREGWSLQRSNHRFYFLVFIAFALESMKVFYALLLPFNPLLIKAVSISGYSVIVFAFIAFKLQPYGDVIRFRMNVLHGKRMSVDDQGRSEERKGLIDQKDCSSRALTIRHRDMGVFLVVIIILPLISMISLYAYWDIQYRNLGFAPPRPLSFRTVSRHLATLEDSTDPQQQKRAVESLISIGQESSKVSLALVRALDDESPEVRLAAAQAMSEIGLPVEGAISALIQSLEDNDSEVRYWSIRALGRLGHDDARAVRALEAAADNDESLSIRATADFYLNQLTGERGR